MQKNFINNIENVNKGRGGSATFDKTIPVQKFGFAYLFYYDLFIQFMLVPVKHMQFSEVQCSLIRCSAVQLN